MRGFKTVVLGTLSIVFLASCAGTKVRRQYEPGYDFSPYRTFAWLPAPEKKFEYLTDPEVVRLKVDEKVKQAIRQVLQAKGLLFDAGQPDFLIAFHTGRYNKRHVQDWGYAYARSSRYWGGRDDIELRFYKEGTLIIDMVDAHTRELFWRGAAVRTLPPGGLEEAEVSRRIRSVVKKILRDFPPQK